MKLKIKCIMTKICVVGLGYVGLPLAHCMDKEFEVIGFDINEKKITDLKNGFDETNELTKEQLEQCKIEFISDSSRIKESDFVIVAVPTPINEDQIPDLSYVKSASALVGKNLKKGAIVVFESTVYPGTTEEVCVPIMEEESGLRCGVGFKIGYSPERVNPGDKEHTIEKIVKIVSGMDEETTEAIAHVYRKVITAGVYKAADIKTAEAAKVIENVQRDLNIALVNELSLIFSRMGIDTKSVVEAAGTKWNFHKYTPGLVGGHCIGVDPYYLTYKANKLDYKPKLILAGREVNEFMSKHVVNILLRGLINNKKHIVGSKVLIMGLTFKENCPDTRNSKIKDVIKYLKKYSMVIFAWDPLISKEEIEKFGVQPYSNEKVDASFVFSPHNEFKGTDLKELKLMMNENPVLIDIKGFYSKKEATDNGFYYRTL